MGQNLAVIFAPSGHFHGPVLAHPDSVAKALASGGKSRWVLGEGKVIGWQFFSAQFFSQLRFSNSLSGIGQVKA